MDRGPLIADTDAIVDFMEAQGSHLKMRGLLRSGRLASTAVSVFEIWRGCRSDAERADARRMLRGVRVYPLTDTAARRAGELDLFLKERGQDIGERDTLIAGICLAVGLPIVTANAKHFGRVPGLTVLPAR